MAVEKVELCSWCGIPLGSANHVRQSVCVRCYKLLINANLSDDEIFGSSSKEKESSLPQTTDEDKE